MWFSPDVVRVIILRHHFPRSCLTRPVFSASLLFFCVVVNTSVHADGSYVLLHLPKGVTIELPKNWTTISDGKRITLDASVQARVEQFGSGTISSELPFAANYYDDYGKTVGIFNIRYYPTLAITQDEAKDAKPQDVEDLDEALSHSAGAGIESAGNRILEWRGTRKASINTLTAFISEYRRTSSDGPFLARLVRVFDGARSFTVTMSYREDQEYFLGPISDHTIRSLRVSAP